MDRDQDTPRLWPPRITVAHRMLWDMLHGNDVSSPSTERDADLARVVAELRWLGWPVVRIWKMTEDGYRWTYGLHKSVIDEARAEIRRIARQNAA